jgi:hypothetical protein
MLIYKKSFLEVKIVRYRIPISKSLHALYYSCNIHHESIQVRVSVIKLEARLAWTKWQSRIELINHVPLHIKEVVIFLKLLHVIILTLYGRFLELSLELFFQPVTSGRLWAKSKRRNVRNATIRIVVIAGAWPFMCLSECEGRDVAS